MQRFPKASLLAIVALACSPASGCSEARRDRGGPVDAGSGPDPGAALDASGVDQDAGRVLARDADETPEEDGGLAATDASAMGGGEPPEGGVDAGPGVADASVLVERACDSPPVDLRSFQSTHPGILPRCAAVTGECIQECREAYPRRFRTQADAQGFAACRRRCIEANPTPPYVAGPDVVDCLTCLDVQVVSCAFLRACGREVQRLRCCIEESCASASDVNSCAWEHCEADLISYDSCLIQRSPTCFDLTEPTVAACFFD